MLTLVYDPNRGEAVPDGLVKHLVGNYTQTDWSLYDDSVTFSTENMFLGIQLAICEGRLDYQQVRYRYKDEIMQPDEYGHPSRWPDGFCMFQVDTLEAVVRAMFKKARV